MRKPVQVVAWLEPLKQPLGAVIGEERLGRLKCSGYSNEDESENLCFEIHYWLLWKRLVEIVDDCVILMVMIKGGEGWVERVR